MTRTRTFSEISTASTEVLGSTGSERVGNTKRPSPSKHYCFTLNNYKESDIKNIIGSIGSDGSRFGTEPKYIFQEETGEDGTPHLQGYVNFDRKVRPIGLFNWEGSERIHWEKCRSPKHAINYCKKEETRTGNVYTNIEFPEEVVVIDEQNLKTWQRNVINIVEGDRDPRKIHWYYDYEGNTGKTQLSKYLVVKHKALILSGKSSDMKYGVISYMQKHNGIAPKIIIFDIPRCSKEFISYQGIEEVKNGLFFSGKYESDMCVYNPPHVVCFANDVPDFTKLSRDRWEVTQIVNLLRPPQGGLPP